MNRKANILIPVIVTIVVLLIIGLVFFGWYRAGYNKAIQLDEAVNTAWADVDATLQRRFDLIPNLVETVKGYASHESELFTNIAEARTKYFQADSRAGKIEAAGEVGSFLSRLIMLREQYPELKANQNFLALQDSLEGTENRINVARQRYNAAVKQLNSFARSFFGSFFARQAGVEPAKYFEASEQARTEVPQVNFNND